MKTAKVWWGATDIGAPHFSSDMLWKTGFRAPDPFFLVEIDGETYMLMSPLEIGRARKEARADQIVLLDSYMKRKDAKTEAHRLIKFLKIHRIREVIVPHGFAHGIARVLGEVCIVHDGGHSLCPERAIKSKKEIAEITAAQRAGEEALGRAVTFLRGCAIRGALVSDGSRIVTSEVLRRIIRNALWEKGYLAFGTIVACGIDAADPHRMGSGPIRARQPIVMDIFPMSLRTHYWADMTRTVFKGEPSEDFSRMYEVVAGAQEMAIGMIRPGADGADIHGAVAEYFLLYGYPTWIAQGYAPAPARRQVRGFIHGLGHGVGIDIHEEPRLGVRHQILETGNVITIEPGLYYSRARRGARGKIPAGGIRIEDMAVVAQNGCTRLTKFPKDLKSSIIL